MTERGMLGDFIADKNRLLKLADLHPSKKSKIFPITIGLKSETPSPLWERACSLPQW
jgi:hypothetical protein